MTWVIKHLHHTFLGDSQNYQSLSAVDHLMNYRPRPSAIIHQVIHSKEGLIVLTAAQKGMK